MGLGLFQRRRKSGMASAIPAELFHLRVLVDSGPNARNLFIVRVDPDDTVEAIRRAVAAQIGQNSLSLFKVSIPWQANYQASAYSDRYGVNPSLLGTFPGWNLDDATQLAASGGARLPAYSAGTGSMRTRRSMRWAAPGYTPTIRDWYPLGPSDESIDVVVRTAQPVSLDWTRPAANPITLSARFAATSSTASSSSSSPSSTVLVDITPSSTVAELKVALLMAAGRPAPAGHLDDIVLWRVDLSESDLASIEARGGLDDGRRPFPAPRNAAPSLMLADGSAPVAEYLTSRGSRADPSHVDLSVWIHPDSASTFAPHRSAPAFTYPLPAEVLAPSPAPAPKERMLPPMTLPTDAHGNFSAWASPEVACPPSPNPEQAQFADAFGDDSEVDVFYNGRSTLRCCALEGLGAPGLIGLGITMSPVPSSVSDHTCGGASSDDEFASWPPTPYVGCADDVTAFTGPSPALTMSCIQPKTLPFIPSTTTPKHSHNMYLPGASTLV